ncbi:MAG: hypothetical protein RL272_638 [Candidatus Parcubacteria bacterium]|jgi:uncharacterized membrane protein YccC
MLKRLFFNPFTGLAAIVVSQWLYVRFVDPSMTAFGLLGALSFSGAVAFVACNVVASFTYRANGTGGGAAVLARLVATIGGAIIATTFAASVFGASAALLYAGSGAIAIIAFFAMRALS